MFDTKTPVKEPMHRRVNSNIVDVFNKPISFHRRAMSNSDLKLSPISPYQLPSSATKLKSQLILPDSLNSSSIQPYLQNDESNFVNVLDASIKHFSNLAVVSNPLKQVIDLKNQIISTTKNIDTMKEYKNELNNKVSSLKIKVQESEQENNKLQEYLSQLKKNAEKLKTKILKSENELQNWKTKNKRIESSVFVSRRDPRSQTSFKPEKYTNSSNDEIDMFNAEENTCMEFADLYHFANPSPKVQSKTLYSRQPIKK